MRIRAASNQKGITLIELLIALVICGMVVAATYRLFIAQNKAYIVQDQVADVQQNIRSVMELMVRDLRMAGYDDDTTPDTRVIIPVFPGDYILTVRENAIRVEYEHYNTHTRRAVEYSLTGTNLTRTQYTDGTEDPDQGDKVLLSNVEVLNFTYGVDEDGDGAMDDRDDTGKLVSPRATPVDNTDWLTAATVNAKSLKVMAVRIVLTARPTQPDPDDKKMVSPRSLTSTVTLRNLYLVT
jgi:prepilin-type N-terminal cleavage/methylation domain-containing protein